jgi:hypothetical protein
VKLRKRAVLDRNRLVIGDVRCDRCRVELVGTVAAIEFEQTVRVRQTAALRLARVNRSARMGVSVRVLFDGRRLVSGTVLGAKR